MKTNKSICGVVSVVDGVTVIDEKSLRQQAAKNRFSLKAVINLLLNQGSEEAEYLAEELSEIYV